MSNQILGHDNVRQTFAHAMQGNRFHHAWLFHGVKGIGKASIAAEFAALYLCEQPIDNAACGTCHHCAMLKAGSHPDFSMLELVLNPKTKKMNRDINIEQTRQALDFLSLSGLKSKKRVLMIDGADLMNKSSANALLKGLEEPNSGSLLLMVCHDMMRLPATIRSRCMLQPFAPLNEQFMRQVLQEKGIADELLDLAVTLGQGSPGSVEALMQPDHAKSLINWQNMLTNLAQSDIGRMQQWLDSHVNNIPHRLISNMVIISANQQLLSAASWEHTEAIYDAMKRVASWPQEVIRHALRPAPALMASLITLRNALKIRI